MATVITEQPTSVRPTAQTSEPILASHVDARYAMRPRHAVVVAMLCALFLTLNYLPLQVTDLWGHVAYGQWIWQHGSMPTADPVSALADGMRVVDTAWLSQVILSAVEPLGVQALIGVIGSIGVSINAAISSREAAGWSRRSRSPNAMRSASVWTC